MVANNPGTDYRINFTNNIALTNTTTLPAITTSSTLTVSGNNYTLDGSGVQRGFFVYSGTANITDLSITNVKAFGGAGGIGFGGGGGGMGAGSALFVASGASVTVTNVNLTNGNANGGNGGNYTGVNGNGGGGGGLGGNGGAGSPASNVPAAGGGGGVGLGANGGSGAGNNGAAGIILSAGMGQSGAGSFAGGGGGGRGNNGGGGVNPANANPSGGFGGGGGGVVAYNNNTGGTTTSSGGSGGFGGGGGGGGGFFGSNFQGGQNGGFGGGGGGISFPANQYPSGVGGFGGGNGGNLLPQPQPQSAGGGGGAGLGGAIFVQQGGNLTLAGSLTVNGNTVTAGIGGGSGAGKGSDGSAFRSGIFLQGNGTITFSPGIGQTATVSDVIADQTGSGGTGLTAGSWNLTKSGLGTLLLSGANTYSGGTIISGGTLAVSTNDNLGSASGGLTFGGGTLQYLSSFDLARSITLNSGGGTFDTNSYSSTLSGNITGPGSLTKTGGGTLMLSGGNTYSGATNVNAGTLQAGATNTLSASSAFTVLASGTLDLNNLNQIIGSLAGSGPVKLGSATLTVGNDNTSTTYSGGISGTGGLTKVGSGFFTLSSNNTYTGPTTVKFGTLQVDGSIALSSLTRVNNGGMLGGIGTVGNTQINSGGVFAPGAGVAGTSVTVAGNLAFQSGALYLVQINSSTASLASVSGTASLAGSVQAVFAPGSYAVPQYTILHSAGLGGTTFCGTRHDQPTARLQREPQLHRNRRAAEPHCETRRRRTRRTWLWRTEREPDQCRDGDQQFLLRWRRAAAELPCSLRAHRRQSRQCAHAAIGRSGNRRSAGGVPAYERVHVTYAQSVR